MEEQNLNQEILNELKALRQDFNRNFVREKLRRRFLISMMNGFATVVGATVLVSIAILLLKQFAYIDVINPIVNRVIDIVESRNK